MIISVELSAEDIKEAISEYLKSKRGLRPMGELEFIMHENYKGEGEYGKPSFKSIRAVVTDEINDEV